MSTDLLSSGLSIDDNDDGWGPSTIPDKFKEIPYYTPFNKGERLGKAADWQQQQYQSKGFSDSFHSLSKDAVSKRRKRAHRLFLTITTTKMIPPSPLLITPKCLQSELM